MKDLTKEYRDILMRKENQIIKETQLYCAKHDILFQKPQNILMRNAMRQFFKEGVYPIARDIWENGLKKYNDE